LVEYAIETVDLVKRYPASVKRLKAAPRNSLRNILETLRERGAHMTALDGVSLRVRKGEVFGLLGPNGAGKTTFIKILCTLILHDEGEAFVNGFDVKKESSQVLRNLQAVIGGGFDWRLKARENLEFYASLYGLSRHEAHSKIDSLLDFAGLRDRANDMYQMLSSGMKRKLVICRSLLLDVPILLFDEPTRGLDPLIAIEIRRLMFEKLSRDEGKTVFLSTHNMWEAEAICDRIAILNRGKIIACDSPDNIRRLVGSEKVYDITLIKAKSGRKQEKMLKDLKETEGVKDLAPEFKAEGTLEKLVLYLEEKHNLSSILKVLLDYGVEIRSIDARDAPLEEVFITLTKRASKE
jgi:ABC-2 type transport system ATP-binding protein